MSVHSARLAQGPVVGAAYATFYTCPAGKRTIIKSIWARNTNAAANRLQIGVKVGATLIGNYSLYGTAINVSGDSVNHQPWLVLNAGDVLQMATPAVGWDVIVSGTELTL